MDILYVITARGGSKGVSRKNIREIAGIPLIVYKIRTVRLSESKGRVIVSTEDEEIADVAKKYGAEVPFIRPQELASDTANSMDVVLHAMDWISKNDTRQYDYICLLEPSSPFLTPADLNNIERLLVEKQPDTLLSMKEADVNTCFIHELDDEVGLSYFYEAIKNKKSVRRQDQKSQYTMNGCIYAAKWDYFLKNKSFHSYHSIPYIMDDVHSIEIDNMMNLSFAEYLTETGTIDVNNWKTEGQAL